MEQSASSQPKKPLLLEFRSSKWLIGFTVFVAAFNDGFGYGAVVPVLPFSLVERSGIPEKDVQFWLSTLLVAFGVSLTVAAPITAWGGDKLGSRQTPMILGSLLALVGTAIFCVAEAPWLLVAARICQGASNGAVYSAGLPLIADTVSQAEVGSWMGFVFSGMTGGFLVSPFLAGILYAKAGYFPVFILVFATLTFDLFLRASIIEAKTATKYTTSRKHGQKRSEVQPDETSPLIQHEPLPSSEIPATKPRRVSANSNSGSSDESSTTAYGSDTVEQRTTKSEEKPKSLFHPLYWFSKAFPKTAVLLGSPRLSAAVYGCFTYMTVVSSFDATLPLFVKRTFGWGSQGVGLIFLAMTAPALAGAGFGALSDHYGPKKVALFGFGISSLSLAFLSLITDDSLVSKIGLAVLLVLMGIGLNLILTPLAADMLYEGDILEENNPDVFGDVGTYALVYSLLCAALGLATAVGPAWSGLIFEEAHWAVSMLTLVAICLSGSVGVLFYTGGAGSGQIARLENSV